MASPAPNEGRPPEYDAFLSYAHRDREVTVAIQRGLHQIGRRLGRLRALRVFRDDNNLTASPDLLGKITEALDRARYVIVVLSSQSATSHWVDKEIRYWLAHRGHEQLMLVLAQGRLDWDADNHRFDPQRSDAAPPVLTEPAGENYLPIGAYCDGEQRVDPLRVGIDYRTAIGIEESHRAVRTSGSDERDRRGYS